MWSNKANVIWSCETWLFYGCHIIEVVVKLMSYGVIKLRCSINVMQLMWRKLCS